MNTQESLEDIRIERDKFHEVIHEFVREVTRLREKIASLETELESVRTASKKA